MNPLRGRLAFPAALADVRNGRVVAQELLTHFSEAPDPRPGRQESGTGSTAHRSLNMSFPTFCCPVATLLMVGSVACASRKGLEVVPDATLARIAELPGADTGNISGSFSNACAMVLEEPKSGQQYLLIRSNTKTRATKKGSGTVTSLVSATGDYAAMPENPPQAGLRVDCASSRILDRLPAPNK